MRSNLDLLNYSPRIEFTEKSHQIYSPPQISLGYSPTLKQLSPLTLPESLKTPDTPDFFLGSPPETPLCNRGLPKNLFNNESDEENDENSYPSNTKQYSFKNSGEINKNTFDKSASLKSRETKLTQKPTTTATRIRPRNGAHQTPKNTARRIPSQTPSRLSTANTHASRVMTPFKTPNHSKSMSAPTPYKTPSALHTAGFNFPVLPITPNRVHTTNYSSRTPSIANEIARACANNKLSLNTPLMPTLPKISLPNLPMTPGFRSTNRNKTPKKDWGTPARLSLGRKSVYHATPNFRTPHKTPSKGTTPSFASITRSPRHSFPPDQRSSPFTQQLITPYKTPTMASPHVPIQSPKFNHVFDMYKAEYEEHNMPENQSEGSLNFTDLDFVDGTVEAVNNLIMNELEYDEEIEEEEIDDFSLKRLILNTFEESCSADEYAVPPAFSMFMLNSLSWQTEEPGIEKCLNELCEEGKLETFTFLEETFWQLKL
jgi:hypothetical protein